MVNIICTLDKLSQFWNDSTKFRLAKMFLKSQWKKYGINMSLSLIKALGEKLPNTPSG